MVDQVIKDRFDNVLRKGETLLSSHVYQNSRGGKEVAYGPYTEWQTQGFALLSAVFGPDDSYPKRFEEATLREKFLIVQPRFVEMGIGILSAAAEDVSQGWTWTFKERLHADLFSDFLDMAVHLVADGGYKDAAAVLAGGVLEEHLRKLCQRNGIATETQGRRGPEPKKASVMNDELAKVPAYNKIDWRSVQGWLDLRNDAAHKHYENYTQQQVEQMIDGIRGFIARHPA